jgi:hypothetical protein
LKQKNINAVVFTAVTILGLAGKAFGCGPFFPNTLLDAGDNAVLQPPVAAFEGELARMKIASPTVRAVPLAEGQQYHDQSSELELSDLAAALKHKKISSEEATVIMQAHLAERMKLNHYLDQLHEWSSYSEWVIGTNGIEHLSGPTNPPPPFPAIALTPGLPREFAEYFRGALAWYQDDALDARIAWEGVLALPPPERKYKSVWAAFMLGKYYEPFTNDSCAADAIKWFQQVRELAKAGFADSAGLVVASIGEEAKLRLGHGEFETAIGLYLDQYAAGDKTAINSLRFAIAAALGESGAPPEQLKSLARNRRIQRAVTAYLISRHTYNFTPEDEAEKSEIEQYTDSTTRWLKAVEAGKPVEVEAAEQLAMAAYQSNDMDAAQRWVSCAGKSAVADWLQAKLYLRAGKVDQGAQLLAKVSREFPQELPTTNNAPANFAQNLSVVINPVWHESIAVGRQALGELGVLHLARREYIEALDALLRSGYWTDAAYVAERVLNTAELKAYVDRNWSADGRADAMTDPLTGFTMSMSTRDQIRYLLARRMARNAANEAPLAYFPTNYTHDYATFLTEVQSGHDTNAPMADRSQNIFAAAIMMRTNGLELFGTELEPDWALLGGEYEFDPTWLGRKTNSWNAKINVADGDEIERASSRRTDPDRRFHYRWQAAALAWDAAQLMPDNSDDTARVLCTGGTWIKDRDAQGADKFYKALVNRCRKTAIGRMADRMRWFPTLDENGNPEPWPPPPEASSGTNEATAPVYTSSAYQVINPEPQAGGTYTVCAGDTLAFIAKKSGVTIKSIFELNTNLDSKRLKVGQSIVIPKIPDAETNAPR